MENTTIQWADHTYNAWVGCTKVSAGCDNCYAERISRRLGLADWGARAPRTPVSPTGVGPRRWNRKNAAGQTRESVFTASMSDVFDMEVPAAWRIRLFRLIRETPHLDWLVLTKRPYVARFLAEQGGSEQWPYPDNVSFGISAESQSELVARWPLVADFPTMRFLSLEPLLGEIDLGWIERHSGHKPDWVIVGGESGPNARNMALAWARRIRDWCDESGVPFFMKQVAGARPEDGDIPADLFVRQYPRFKGKKTDA